MAVRMMINTAKTIAGAVLLMGSLTLRCAKHASNIVIPSQIPAHTIIQSYQYPMMSAAAPTNWTMPVTTRNHWGISRFLNISTQYLAPEIFAPPEKA